MLGPMLPLALATSLAVLVAGGGALPPPAPLAVVRVPDEPGAIVLPDSQPTVQAVAADLDGDGAPELVRLMGGRSGPLYVEAYRETGGSWVPAASRITAVPGAAGLGEAAYARRPARLLAPPGLRARQGHARGPALVLRAGGRARMLPPHP